MVIVFQKRGLIIEETKERLLALLEEECKMLTGFMRTLRSEK